MGEDIFRYWVTYKDSFGELRAAEASFDYELNTGDNVARAEGAMGNGPQERVTILFWTRLQ